MKNFGIYYYYMIIHELTTNYNGETCLIQYAPREKFCVGIDMVSDYTVPKTKKMVK